MSLRLLKAVPPRPPKPDLVEIYKRAMGRKLSNIPENPSKQWVISMAYLMIKGLPIIWAKKINRGFQDTEKPTFEFIQNLWGLVGYTDGLISRLTPRELIKMFPIEKKYDGMKTESKDYFFTMDVVREFGIDNPIGEGVSEILFDYQNGHITNYAIFKMGIVDDLRRIQGQPGMMEEFMSGHGVTPKQIVTGYDGKQYLFDPEENTTFEVKKARPRYLRVVKSAK